MRTLDRAILRVGSGPLGHHPELPPHAPVHSCPFFTPLVCMAVVSGASLVSRSPPSSVAAQVWEYSRTFRVDRLAWLIAPRSAPRKRREVRFTQRFDTESRDYEKWVASSTMTTILAESVTGVYADQWGAIK